MKGQEWSFFIAVCPHKDTRKFNQIECNKECEHHHEIYFFAYIQQVHDSTTECKAKSVWELRDRKNASVDSQLSVV